MLDFLRLRVKNYNIFLIEERVTQIFWVVIKIFHNITLITIKVTDNVFIINFK